jgi:hypothetical protein
VQLTPNDARNATVRSVPYVNYKRHTGTIGRLCRPRLVRLTLGDEPVFVVGELVTVLTADVDAGSVRTRRRVEVGVGNIQRRTAHRCRIQTLCFH